jgi:hypothetical protein
LLAGKRHFATSIDGKHLDHILGEASRSLTGERHFSASERINNGKHRPIVGISIAHRREAFHSPRGGSISVLLASRAHLFMFFCFVYVFVLVFVLVMEVGF